MRDKTTGRVETRSLFIDRFEGDQAVLLHGEQETETAVIPIAWLPPEARERDVLKITACGDASIITINGNATLDRAERARSAVLKALRGGDKR